MKVRKEDYLNNLYLFYRYFITRDYANPVPAPHIKSLADKLTMLKLDKGKNRLAVSMPPRHSKSSMVTIAFPLWLIFQNPDLNILIVAGSGLSEKFGISIRDYVTTYGKYFHVHLSDVKQSSTYIMFCDDNNKLFHGSIRLTSAGGSITGQDADYIIVDDPYKGLDEEFTPSALQKKIDWANRVIEQRIEPHTKYCILHTRWNTNDLIGYYQRTQPEDFTFVSYPAIKDNNTPLWRERYSIEELMKKREKINERLFSSIYQQKPLDETSDFFNLNKIHFTPLPPEDEIISKVRGWDIAGSSKLTSDFTAGAPLYLTNNKNILLTDYVYGHFGSENNHKIRQTAEIDGADMPILIETGVAGAGKLLFKEWKTQLKGYQVFKASPITSKTDCATPLANAIIDNKFYVNIKDDNLRDAFINEFKSFPNGQHDDIVDAVSHGYNWLKHNNDLNDYKPEIAFIEL